MATVYSLAHLQQSLLQLRQPLRFQLGITHSPLPARLPAPPAAQSFIITITITRQRERERERETDFFCEIAPEGVDKLTSTMINSGDIGPLALTTVRPTVLNPSPVRHALPTLISAAISDSDRYLLHDNVLVWKGSVEERRVALWMALNHRCWMWAVPHPHTRAPSSKARKVDTTECTFHWWAPSVDNDEVPIRLHRPPNLRHIAARCAWVASHHGISPCRRRWNRFRGWNHLAPRTKIM